MKKAIFLATMMFASAGVSAMELTSGADKGGVKESVATSDPRKQVMEQEFNQLMEAASENNLKEVKKIIAKHDEDISTIRDLIVAQKNKIEMSGSQLEQSRERISYVTELVNLSDKDGDFPLFIAVKNGYGEIVKYLVDHGAVVNKAAANEAVVNEIVDRSRNTLLFKACYSGNETFVKVLVEYGANVNQKNFRGETPLIYACRKGHEKVVKYLVDKGADINKENNDGETPLFWACALGNKSIVKYLIDKGADVKKEYKDGETLLFAAIRSRNVDLVEYLIDQGVDVNKKNKEGVTPLKYIIKNHWPDSYETTELESIIELLVKYGANANETCRGYSLLSYSLGMLPNPINLVKTLVDHKAEINVLCIGVPCVDLEERTVNIFSEKKTPLDIAEKRGFTEIIEYLKGKGAKSANDLSSDF